MVVVFPARQLVLLGPLLEEGCRGDGDAAEQEGLFLGISWGEAEGGEVAVGDDLRRLA